MPRNRATSHLVWGYAEWLASVEIVERDVRFFGPHINPVLVEKNRSQRRLLYGRLPGENLQLLGITRLGKFKVRIEIAIVSVAAAEHGLPVGSPPHPCAIGITLLVAAGWRWFMQGRGRADQNP